MRKYNELLCILANLMVIRTHHTVVLKTCFLLWRQAISTHTVGRKRKRFQGPGDQGCVGAIQYEKSPPPEQWKPIETQQFCTLLDVLYHLVPSVSPETSGVPRISCPRNRHCPRAQEQLTPHARARCGVILII